MTTPGSEDPVFLRNSGFMKYDQTIGSLPQGIFLLINIPDLFPIPLEGRNICEQEYCKTTERKRRVGYTLSSCGRRSNGAKNQPTGASPRFSPQQRLSPENRTLARGG
jgi:hypothetical protein